MATKEELKQYGQRITRDPSGRVRLYSPEAGLAMKAAFITDPQNLQGYDIEDLTDQEISALFGGVGAENISASRIGHYTDISRQNVENRAAMAKQVSDANAFNQFIAQNPNAASIPSNLDPEGKYSVVGGVLKEKSAIQNEKNMEAEVAAGRMKKVPIGQGFGYIPVGSPADLEMQKPTQPTKPTQPIQPTGPVSGYTGPSIVDYLSSIGQPSDYNSRAKLATQLGIQNYTGSATQNTEMLKILRARQGTGTPAGGGQPQGAGAPGLGTGGESGDTGERGTGGEDDFMAKVEGILAKYGVKPPDPDKDPVASFQESYKELFKSLGLDTVKQNIENAIERLSAVDKELGEKIAEVDENPWLSNADRSRKISALQNKYETRRSGVANELKLYESLFDDGRDEARFVAGQAMALTGKQEALTTDLIFKAIDRAEKELDVSSKLDTEIIDVNGQKQLINKKTGEVIKTLGRSTSPTSDKGPASYQEWVLAGSPGTFAEWVAKTGRPPTQAQETVATYAARLEQANPTLTDLTDDIAKMNPVNFEAQVRVPSFLQSSEIQQYMQAARNFINATLRRESGAVISDSEFDNAYKQYLPKPGDSVATLAQKKQNRDIVQASFKKGAGPAYQSVDELLGVKNNDPLGIR